MDDNEYVEFQTILQGLGGELNNLYSSAKSFVSDQIEREKQYGQDTRVSPKQWRWLRDLYSEKVGTLPAQGRVAGKMTDDEVDIDDEIPF